MDSNVKDDESVFSDDDPNPKQSSPIVQEFIANRFSQTFRRAFFEWHSHIAHKKNLFRRRVIAKYTIDLKTKQRIFDLLNAHRNYSINIRTFLLEVAAHKSIRLKERVFKGFKKLKSQKSRREVFKQQLKQIFERHISNKYFQFLRNARLSRETTKSRMELAIQNSEMSTKRRVFSHLQNFQIILNSLKTALHKKQTIARYIFKRTHARILFELMRKQLQQARSHTRIIQKSLHSQNLRLLRSSFAALNQYRQSVHLKSYQISRANKFNSTRIESFFRKIFSTWAARIDSKRSRVERFHQLVALKKRNDFRMIIDRLKINLNMHEEMAEKHHERRILRVYFESLLLFMKAVSKGLILQGKHDKHTKKNVVFAWKSLTKKALLETKKRYIITRFSVKSKKKQSLRIWKHSFAVSQALIRLTKIRSRLDLSRAFISIANSIEIKQQSIIKSLESDTYYSSRLLKFYFSILTEYLRLQQEQARNTARARKHYRSHVLSQSFAGLLQIWKRKALILASIRKKEHPTLLKCMLLWKQYSHNKLAKLIHTQQAIHANESFKLTRILLRWKEYSRRTRAKHSRIQDLKRGIQFSILARVATAWKSIATRKRQTRQYFEDQSMLITKKLAFGKIRRILIESILKKQKLQIVQMKKRIKIKQEVFRSLQQLRIRKIKSTQAANEKECIYLAKIMIKSIVAWKIYIQAARKLKLKCRLALEFWNRQRLVISMRRLKRFAARKAERRQQEFDAFKLHVAHNQGAVIRKIVAMGLRLCSEQTKQIREESIHRFSREEQLARKYSRKWRAFVLRRREMHGLNQKTLTQAANSMLPPAFHQETNLKINNNSIMNYCVSPHFQSLSNQQSPKFPVATATTNAANTYEEHKYMSFLPSNQAAQVSAYQSASGLVRSHAHMIALQKQKQQQQQDDLKKRNNQIENQQDQFKSPEQIKVHGAGSDIVDWFENDFLKKPKLQVRQLANVASAAIAISTEQIARKNSTSSFVSQSGFNPPQHQHQQLHNPLNTSDQHSIHFESDIYQGKSLFPFSRGFESRVNSNHAMNTNNTVKLQQQQYKYQPQSQQQFYEHHPNIPQLSQQQQQQYPNQTIITHLANLLDADQSQFVDDLRENHKQLDRMVEEYNRFRSTGDNISAQTLKPKIQKKYEEINQLKSISTQQQMIQQNQYQQEHIQQQQQKLYKIPPQNKQQLQQPQEQQQIQSEQIFQKFSQRR